MQIRVQHVSVPYAPGQQATARHFYGKLFGLHEVRVPQSLSHLPIIWYRLGDTELHLYSEELRPEMNGQHFCLAVESHEALATLRQQLLDGGVDVQETIEIPSRPRYICRDPFNNLIEFTTIEYDYLA